VFSRKSENPVKIILFGCGTATKSKLSLIGNWLAHNVNSNFIVDLKRYGQDAVARFPDHQEQ